MSFRDEFLKARLARMPAQPPAPQPPPPEHAAGWHAGLDMNNGADEDEELEELDTFNMDSLGAAAAASGNFLRCAVRRGSTEARPVLEYRIIPDVARRS